MGEGILNQLFFFSPRHATSIVEKTKVEPKSLKKATVAWLHLALKFRQGTTAASPACNLSGCLNWLSLTLPMLGLGWSESVVLWSNSHRDQKTPECTIWLSASFTAHRFSIAKWCPPTGAFIMSNRQLWIGSPLLVHNTFEITFDSLAPKHWRSRQNNATKPCQRLKSLSLTWPLVQVLRTLFVLIRLIILCSQTAAVYDIIPTFICSAFVSRSRKILSATHKQNKDYQSFKG